MVCVIVMALETNNAMMGLNYVIGGNLLREFLQIYFANAQISEKSLLSQVDDRVQTLGEVFSG